MLLHTVSYQWRHRQQQQQQLHRHEQINEMNERKKCGAKLSLWIDFDKRCIYQTDEHTAKDNNKSVKDRDRDREREREADGMVNDESASWHIVNGTHQIKAHTFSKKKLKQTQRIGQCETVVVWDPGWEMIWWCGVRGGASRHIFRCAWVRLFDSIKCKANDISHGSVRFSSNNISIQFQISVARSTHTHTHRHQNSSHD